MKPTITSFNGYTFATGEAAFPEQNFFPQGSTASVELPRSDNPPVISAVQRQSKIITLRVYPLNTFTTQVNVYHGYFYTNDRSTRQLVITDENSVQWYVMARVEGEPHAYADHLDFTLRVPDPVWQFVTPVVDTWNITTSGQTHAITTVGNRSVYPIISAVATSPKVNGFQYFEYRGWYNPQTTAALKDETIDLANAAWNTSTLINDSGVGSMLINQVGGINNSVTSIPYDTRTGTIPAAPYPLYLDTEQVLVTVDPGTSSGNLTVTRGVGGTTAASHADNTVMGVSRMYADGRDIRLRILGGGAGVDWPYWLSGINTSGTKLQAVLDFDPGITLTLSGALDNHTAVTKMTFKKTPTNLAALQLLARKKFFTFLIGTEIFTFQKGASIDLVNYTISTTATDARGAYKSTKATHSDGDTVIWLQYIAQFCYGNTGMAAPSQDNSQQPLITLSSSTNTSWVWDATFWANGGTRAARWVPINAKSPGGESRRYTGKHTLGSDTTPTRVFRDPATAIGAWGGAYQQGTNWVGEQFSVYWIMYNAAGFTTASIVLALYRWSSDWPAGMCLQVSTDGANWSNVTGFPEAKPASTKTWTAGATHSAVALGATYPYIRLIAQGAIAGNVPTDVVAMEATSITLVRDSAKVPQLGYTSASKLSAYHFTFVLTNVGTGDYVTVDTVIPYGETLQIDCRNKNVVHVESGGNLIGSLTPNAKRNYWVTLEPPTANGGVTNGGTWQYDDTGTAGVTLTTTYYDRIV